jgi:hypothetical protein
MVDALIVAAPTLDRQTAAHFLLHTSHGRTLARHMSEISKGEPMPQVDVMHLKNIESVKEFTKAAKSELSEFEFSQVLMGHAKINKQAGESDAQAFSRILTAPENTELRQAYHATKAWPDTMSLTPTQVGGNDAFDTSVDDSSAKAYDQLMMMADKMRKTSPHLTVAQAFDRVFSKEENRRWASAATGRFTGTRRSSSPPPRELETERG